MTTITPAPEFQIIGRTDNATVVGLGGAKEAGKDAFADILVAKYGFQKLGMSMGLHDDLMTLNPYMRVGTEPYGKGDGVRDEEGSLIWRAGEFVRYADIHDTVGYVAMKRQYEVRIAQQLMGTEIGRKRHEDVWADDIAARLPDMLKNGPVVVTGLRHLNEIAMVEKRGGFTAYVKREVTSPEQDVEAQQRADRAHSSENSVNEYDFMARILNYGTLDDLEVIADQFYASVITSQWTRDRGDHSEGGQPKVIPQTTVTEGWPVYDR